MSPLRQRVLAGVAGLILAVGIVFFLQPPSGGSANSAHTPAQQKLVHQTHAPQGTSRTVTWDELMPVGWDPMKEFKTADLSRMGDADPRASEMLAKLRSMWDDAPIRSDLDGQRIRLPGYVVPIEMGKTGLSEFLLVPYFGACIHTPPPPSNQIVHVRLNKRVHGINSMDTVWIDGVVTVKRATSLMGTSAYRMEVAGVSPYIPGQR